jgi:type I restriction enzyme S subunit
MVTASELILKRGGSVNPSKFPEETFELLSIPAFDKNEPEILLGSEIGSSKSCIEPGDVLLSKIVPHIRRCWVVPEKSEYRQIGSGEWIIFRDDRFDKGFLKHFLTSDIFHRQFMNTVAGVGGSLVRARPAEVERIEIPLPPLAEQKRIAAILDKADAIRRKRQQAIQLADDFLRALFLDMFGDPVTNPKGWEVKSVADLIRAGVILQVQDGNHGNDHPKVSDFTESGVPFVTANVVRRGKILFDQCYYLDHSWLDRLRIGFAKPRDVLISHKGSLGFTAVLDDTYEDYIFSPQTTYYRVNEERLLPEYLKGYFDSGFFQRLFAKEGIQSTRAYLGITRQKDLPIMIPDMSAQMRFMDVLSKYKGLSGKLFEPTARSEFFSSLSQKAFRGEL